MNAKLFETPILCSIALHVAFGTGLVFIAAWVLRCSLP